MNGVEWLIHQIGVLPFQGTSATWRNEPKGNSWSSGKRNFKSYIWGEITSCTSIGWGELEGRSSVEKGHQTLVDKKLNMSQQHTLETKTKRALPAGRGRCYFHLWYTSLSAVISPVLLSMRERWTNWSSSSIGPQRWLQDRNIWRVVQRAEIV